MIEHTDLKRLNPSTPPFIAMHSSSKQARNVVVACHDAIGCLAPEFVLHCLGRCRRLGLPQSNGHFSW
jgi:hypothetical protein